MLMHVGRQTKNSSSGVKPTKPQTDVPIRASAPKTSLLDAVRVLVFAHAKTEQVKITVAMVKMLKRAKLGDWKRSRYTIIFWGSRKPVVDTTY